MVQTILKIEGMACSMCEAHINDCIRQNFEIKKIKTSHSKGESVVISEDALDGEQLKKALADMGYTLVSLTSEPYKKKRRLSR